MNRIWFGAALLAVLLVFGVCTGAWMERTHLQQAADLQQSSALALAGNWKGAENYAASARREWDRQRSVTTALCDHEIMDQIDGMFAQLEVFAKAGDGAAYGSTCRYLASQLEALGKSHSMNFQNLF